MKTISLIQGEAFSSKQVFAEILSVPAQGCTVADMRKFIKILDAIDKAEASVELEDADFEVLKSAYNSNRFRISHKDLVAIGDSLG